MHSHFNNSTCTYYLNYLDTGAPTLPPVYSAAIVIVTDFLLFVWGGVAGIGPKCSVVSVYDDWFRMTWTLKYKTINDVNKTKTETVPCGPNTHMETNTHKPKVKPRLPKYDSQSGTTIDSCLWLRTILGRTQNPNIEKHTDCPPNSRPDHTKTKTKQRSERDTCRVWRLLSACLFSQECPEINYAGLPWGRLNINYTDLIFTRKHFTKDLWDCINPTY
jgi:hypothetical protein